MADGNVAEVMRLANISNGLAYPHDDVCNFQSNHGHQFSIGYFRLDAMPYRAVIHLLRGGVVEIIDATHGGKALTDAQKFGVPTWCIAFNRAIRMGCSRVCDWQTKEMERAALKKHRKTITAIRKLVKVYGCSRPATVGENVLLKTYRNVPFDDKPEIIARLKGVCYGAESVG